MEYWMKLPLTGGKFLSTRINLGLGDPHESVQILAMFADPFSIFEVGLDPTKLPITAIIVDKDGK